MLKTSTSTVLHCTPNSDTLQTLCPLPHQAETRSKATQPAAWWRWAVVLAPGLLLWFWTLPGLNVQQSRVLGVFLATIVALVAQPVPMGVSVLRGHDAAGGNRDAVPGARCSPASATSRSG